MGRLCVGYKGGELSTVGVLTRLAFNVQPLSGAVLGCGGDAKRGGMERGVVLEGKDCFQIFRVCV